MSVGVGAAAGAAASDSAMLHALAADVDLPSRAGRRQRCGVVVCALPYSSFDDVLTSAIKQSGTKVACSGLPVSNFQ
jgi:hypothetical protein